MSIGNVKTEGSKGNNFPWQLRMLNGLQAIINGNTTCCDKLTSLLTPQKRTPYVEVTTADGSIQGIYSISIANTGAAAGLVNGVSIPAGTILNFDACLLNNVLNIITWDATGTTFLITALTD